MKIIMILAISFLLFSQTISFAVEYSIEQNRSTGKFIITPDLPEEPKELGWVGVIIRIIVGLFLVMTFLMSFVITIQQNAKVIERFGKYSRIARAGISFKIPWIEWVAGEETLRITQIDVKVETKTKDNVFVIMKISVQAVVKPDKVFEAFYKLEDSEQQITSYVFDVVRAEVPKMPLDDVFERKDEIAQAVKSQLDQTMDQFGYDIVKALVTDIDPDARVKDSMNEINASERLRVAAVAKGEAEKIVMVKKAEAEAQSKALQGKGVADQRKEIIDGYRRSVEEFQEKLPNVNTNEVVQFVLMTQFFDMLKDVANQSKTNTIMLPHSPSGMKDFMDQIRNAVIVGNEVKNG